MLNLLFLLFLSPVNANDAPQILPFLPRINIGIEKSLKIPCSLLFGTEPIQFQWFKNNLEIEPDSRIFWESKSSNSILVFKHIRLNDSGNYSCQAQNVFGSNSQSSYLQVQGKISYFVFCLNFEFPPKCGA